MLLSKKELQYLNHGKIYKLVSNVTGDVYYGSTISSLKQRLTDHKAHYKRYLNGKYRYVTSFKILETGDYDIHLVENYRCLNRKQLEKIEGIYIKYNDCINRCVVGRTPKETHKAYYEKNKDKKLKYQKEYDKKNKDKLKEYQKEYRVNNKDKINKKFDCECGSKYIQRNKSRHMKCIKHQKYLLRKEYLIPNFKSCSL